MYFKLLIFCDKVELSVDIVPSDILLDSCRCLVFFLFQGFRDKLVSLERLELPLNLNRRPVSDYKLKS